ncbi:MAG: sigma-70 family RNA polymerase sigma factor [Chloroflexota bacterium]
MRRGADLVSRAQQGDTEAFGALYEEYSSTIYRFLRRRFDGPDDAVEDLTADVFVKAFEKLDRYHDRGVPFTAWLYRIAHNHLVDYLRLRQRAATYSLDDATDVPEKSSGLAFGQVLDRETLEPALAALTNEQRQAVQYRFLDGLSVAETAVLMQRSDEAVKKLQARALVNLRRLLAPALPQRSRRLQALPQMAPAAVIERDLDADTLPAMMAPALAPVYAVA